MFPWVNRVTHNPYSQYIQNNFSDNNNLPLHGLFANSKRDMQVFFNEKTNERNLSIKLLPSKKLK